MREPESADEFAERTVSAEDADGAMEKYAGGSSAKWLYALALAVDAGVASERDWSDTAWIWLRAAIDTQGDLAAVVEFIEEAEKRFPSTGSIAKPHASDLVRVESFFRKDNLDAFGDFFGVSVLVGSAWIRVNTYSSLERAQVEAAHLVGILEGGAK